MSTAEQKPQDVFDPGYWLPFVDGCTPIRWPADEEQAGFGKRHEISMALAFEEIQKSNRTPERSLLSQAEIDLEQFELGTVLRFERERLLAVSHPDLRVASAAISENQLSDVGLAGMSYSRSPAHEYDPANAMYHAMQYERQLGCGVVLTRQSGRPSLFGVRPHKNRLLAESSTYVGGVPFYANKLIQETRDYRYEPLKFPTNRKAFVGLTSQSVDIKKINSALAQITRLERINFVDVFELPK